MSFKASLALPCKRYLFPGELASTFESSGDDNKIEGIKSKKLCEMLKPIIKQLTATAGFVILFAIKNEATRFICSPGTIPVTIPVKVPAKVLIICSINKSVIKVNLFKSI